MYIYGIFPTCMDTSHLNRYSLSFCLKLRIFGAKVKGSVSETARNSVNFSSSASICDAFAGGNSATSMSDL